MLAGQSWVILVQQACRWYRKILETCCWPVSIRFHPPELPSPFSYTYMKLLSLLKFYSSNLFLSLSPFTSIEKKEIECGTSKIWESHTNAEYLTMISTTMLPSKKFFKALPQSFGTAYTSRVYLWNNLTTF